MLRCYLWKNFSIDGNQRALDEELFLKDLTFEEIQILLVFVVKKCLKWLLFHSSVSIFAAARASKRHNFFFLIFLKSKAQVFLSS